MAHCLLQDLTSYSLLPWALSPLCHSLCSSWVLGARLSLSPGLSPNFPLPGTLQGDHILLLSPLSSHSSDVIPTTNSTQSTLFNIHSTLPLTTVTFSLVVLFFYPWHSLTSNTVYTYWSCPLAFAYLPLECQPFKGRDYHFILCCTAST